MDDRKLIPAHVFYTRWFIRIRWISILILLLAIFISKYLFRLQLELVPLLIITGVLLVINVVHLGTLKKLAVSQRENIVRALKREILAQVIGDFLLLSLIIHFSGGIENPMIILFFLHMIITSSIFSKKDSYLLAGLAVFLIASISITEAYGIIPHYPLGKPGLDSLYQDKLYIFGAGLIFVFTSVMIVGLTHLVKNKSLTVEEAYVRTNYELERMSKLQNQYVLRVTHDIKGHLAAILSRLGVLKAQITGPLNSDQEEFIGAAYNRTEQLSGFVQDLLSLSRKRLAEESEMEVFSVREVIEKVNSRIYVLASDKSIVFNSHIDKLVDKMEGNPLTIEELYSNILRNSIQYTPRKGRISLKVRIVNDVLISEVIDSGIGISREELPKIFQEFYRGIEARNINANSSGLGLSIVKQIIENHGGDITADSEPGIWTKFTFSLPLKQASAYPEPSF